MSARELSGEPANVLTDRISPAIRDGYVYVVKLTLAGTSYSAFLFLTHEKLYDDEDFKAMVDDCVRVNNTTRLHNKREEMAKSKTRIDLTKIDGTNERCFAEDVEFTKAAICDRYQFKILCVHHTTAELLPTVLQPVAKT